MEAIILLGGPGAGKGTLAKFLKAETSYQHVSTGDMLRAAIASGSKVGLEAKRYMESGELVPDSVILGIIKERILQDGEDAKFMFDGFPRTLEQAEGLDALAAELGVTISHVFNLEASREALIPRLCGRRICSVCGEVYHMINRPPKQEGICDIEGGKLYQRPDDSEETIMNRLDVYDKQTAPLIEYYEAKGLIRSLDASGHADYTDQQADAVLKG